MDYIMKISAYHDNKPIKNIETFISDIFTNQKKLNYFLEKNYWKYICEQNKESSWGSVWQRSHKIRLEFAIQTIYYHLAF